MSCAESSISWTEKTHGFFRGCSLKDKGCQNCYAMFVAGGPRHRGPGKAYHGLTVQTPRGPIWNGKTMAVEHVLDDPRKWKKPSLIFSNSMSDWQHGTIAWDAKQRLLQSYLQTPRHVYQLLTKRAEEQLAFFTQRAALGFQQLPANFWVGVSITHPEVAHRLELLRRTPGISMRWVSFEPLLADLGEVDLSGIDWAVIGGESEHDKRSPARPMHTAWVLNLLERCKRYRVPVLFKQHGRYVSLVHLPPGLSRRVRVAARWVGFDGQWTTEHDSADPLIKWRDQHFNKWFGKPLEHWPTPGFFSEELRAATA